MSDKRRPKRLPIPDVIKEAVLKRQKGKDPHTGAVIASIYHAEFNHNPALGIRPVNKKGTDYVPRQLDPRRIEALLKKTHNKVTNGDPEIEKKHMLRKDYDKARISKAKRNDEKQAASKQKQAERTFGKRKGVKLQCPDRRQLLKMQ